MNRTYHSHGSRWTARSAPPFELPHGFDLYISIDRAQNALGTVVETTSEIRKIAFLGDYLPRKCGIATFTSDVLQAVANAHPQIECIAVPVNDREGGYEYPAVVRFEVEEKDLASYQRAADFLNISNVDIVC